MMRADQGRIRDILKETILALLNNGVEFNSELEVDGLLGVTVDRKDVFLVKISEVVPSLKKQLAGGVDKDSSDEETSPSATSNKLRRKRRSPSPKCMGKVDKRQRVASPTQSTPSSTSQKEVKGEGGDFAQVDIDLTSVKMEPVDTTVSDSNHSGADMSDVGPSFDYNQQQPHITSIQAVSQAADSESAGGSWQGSQSGDMGPLNQQGLHAAANWPDGDDDYSGEEEDDDFEDEEAWEEAMMIQQQQILQHQQRMMQQQQQQQQKGSSHGMPMGPRGLMMPQMQLPPGMQMKQHKQLMDAAEEVESSETESEGEEEEQQHTPKKKKKSAFDYYKSNPKHPDITKAIMEGSKAVLEKIIGMSAAKAKAGKKKEEKAKKKKVPTATLR